MRKVNRLPLAAGASFLLLTAAGCIDRDVNGDVTTYDYSWWVPVVVFMAALAAVPAGLLFRRRNGRRSWGLVFVCPILLVLVFPMTLTEKVKVDPQHFESHAGMWFAPDAHNVRFDDLSAIRRVTYEVRTRRGGRSTRQKFLCVHRNGGATETVQLGTLVREAAPEIIRHAAEHGVAVSDERQ